MGTLFRKERKIIATYDLGHVFLHQKDDINMLEESADSDIKEYEANLFVMEFMSQMRPVDRDYLDFSPEPL